jgi:hypothetical protein
MPAAHPFNMNSQRLHNSARENRHAILVALAITDRYFPAGEFYILDAQPTALSFQA